jgi:aspartyl-tRNA(Asn)/glutamyl-tRNA(Gln) amidotransferase subunit A
MLTLNRLKMDSGSLALARVRNDDRYRACASRMTIPHNSHTMSASIPHTIAEASRLIQSRELSPVELVGALLERIAPTDRIISSFLTVTADEAMAQARRAEAEIVKGRYRGALHGIPFGAKDNYETRGILTTGHSRAYARHVPRDNAAVIDRLYEAGAALCGKLALHELAHGGPSFDLPWPPARNPWNPAHFTGGSSSGSAAALAAGLVLFALGSDTGGSIRTPASFCGLVGMKPTFGLVSRYGVLPNSWSLDHCGPMTRTVEDCAIVLQAMIGHDPRDRSSVAAPMPPMQGALRQDLKGVRIGVVRHFWEDESPAGPALASAADEALRVLQSLGATIETVRLRPVREYCDAWTLIEAPETFSVQREALIARPDDFGAVFHERTLIACLMQSADYVDAQRLRGLMIDEMRPLWEKYDVLFTAGAGPAPRLSPNLAAWPSLNRFSPFALLGAPAIVVPAGYSDDGLPLSIQLVAKPFDDAKLLGVAHAYEHATQWWRKREAAPLSFGVPEPIAYERQQRSTAFVDPKILSLCERSAASAGLHLHEEHLAILCGAAPHVLEMIANVRAATEAAEPASVFSLQR